jgi:adenosylcobinamide-GDP ribazoletransferase
MAERFVWRTSRAELWAWAIALGLAGGALGRYAVALAAPLALGAWWLYLRYRVGGMSGDCLGAGVEVTEIALLAALAVTAAA